MAGTVLTIRTSKSPGAIRLGANVAYTVGNDVLQKGLKEGIYSPKSFWGVGGAIAAVIPKVKNRDAF